MSVIARNWVKTHCQGSGRAAKAVLMVLADAAKEKPIERGTGTAHQCCLKQSTVADDAEYSVPTVQRALDVLNDTGRVLRKFRHDKDTGYRSACDFFLNTNNEPIHAFAGRCGIDWKPSRAKTPKHHFDVKATRGLNIIHEAPTPQNDVASTSNRDLTGRERARRGVSRATELPQEGTLPDECRQMARAEFEATNAQIEALWKRFHNHYRNLAKPRDRRHHNWLAKFRQWCLDDLPARKPSAGDQELSDDHWSAHVKGWIELGRWHPTLGEAPDRPGCRAPQAILEKFGLARAA